MSFVNREFNENMLKEDEYIICTNATIIVDKDGNFSGWIDNDRPMIVWKEDKLN